MSGCFPHYALVTIGANMGISKMTREHLGVALGLTLPLFIVVTKVDIAPENILKNTLKHLFKLLKHAGKKSFIIKRNKDINVCLNENGVLLTNICPIFLVSSVKGTNIKLLTDYLSRIKPQENNINNSSDTEKVFLEINDVFNVVGVGIVILGHLDSGYLEVGMTLQLGPFSDNNDRLVVIKGLHIHRVPVKHVDAGTVCTVAIRSLDRKNQIKRSMIRRGMILSSEKQIPSIGFISEILILHNSSTIKNGFQAIAHCGSVCQAIKLELPEGIILRTGDKTTVTCKWLFKPEYVRVGTSIVFYEGTTKAFGKIISIII